MEIIYDKNCSGKTKQLIEKSLKEDTPILVFSPIKASSLEEKSMVYFNQKVRILYYDDLDNYNGKVLIDDLDKNLDFIIRLALNNCNISVDAITMSSN